MKLLILIFCLLTIFPSAHAQEEIIEEIIEHITLNEETRNIESLAELLNTLHSNPMNLNAANKEDLNNCMLFSPFQVFGILKYREKYGIFFSIYELQSIPGFNTEFLQLIAPLISVNAHEIELKKKQTNSLLLSDFSLKYPESYAYYRQDSIPPAYPGSPLKTIHRLRFENAKNINIGAAYEKDAGEQWQNNAHAEHLCGYIKITPEKILSNFIIGNFQIHRGLGLVHGLGFNTSSGTLLNGYRRSYAKGFASSLEYKYYRGIYAETKFGKWTADMFLSAKKEDLSLYNFSLNKPLHNYIRETGLHRTMSEINGKNLALRRSSGLSINRSNEHLRAGFALSYDIINLTQEGKDSIPDFSELNSSRANGSAYFVAYAEKFEVFAELACSQEMKLAGIIGANWQMNPALSLSSLYHHYEPDYNSQFPNAYQAGENPENQKGFNLKATIVPCKNFLLFLNTDITSAITNISLQKGKYEIKNSLQLNYDSHSNFKFQFRYKHYQLPLDFEEKEVGAAKTYYSGKEKIRYQYELKLLNKIILSGRFELSLYNITSGQTKLFSDYQNASLMYQQLKYKFDQKLQITYRFLAFNIKDWENRIYCYEPGLRYSFLFPAYYGTGTQNLLLINYKVSRALSIRSKIGRTEYKHKRETGTGIDARPGNHILNIELQMQLRM